MTVDSKGGLNVAVTQDRRHRLQINIIFNKPTSKTMTQVIPTPTFNRIPALIKVTNPNLATLVPVLDGIKDILAGHALDRGFVDAQVLACFRN
jgi:hypothetical protein